MAWFRNGEQIRPGPDSCNSAKHLSSQFVRHYIVRACRNGVIGKKRGTPVSVVKAALATYGQAWTFEPMIIGGLWHGHGTTIGAVAAANISGCPRRIMPVPPEISLIGCAVVEWQRGELIKLMAPGA